MIDLEKHRWRSRFEAWLLDAGAAPDDDPVAVRTAAAIGAMTGTVVELGAGTGANARWFADGVHVIAVEPNPHMHERLRAAAERHAVDLEIRTVRGESIDVEDASVDAVVGTLLLCGVDDPARVIAEAHRVLRPGGTYFFVEHVVAPDASLTRRVQSVFRRPNAWLFNGCRIDQDTESLLRAGPFDRVDVDRIDRGPRAAYVRHQIVGTATKAG